MDDCVFCRIAAGTAPARIVFKDEKVVVFHDLHPQTRVHLLLIPREHITSLNELQTSHDGLIIHMMRLLPELARAQGLQDGFRIIINTGPCGGQEVPHLHIHLVGGGALPDF